MSFEMLENSASQAEVTRKNKKVNHQFFVGEGTDDSQVKEKKGGGLGRMLIT